MGKQLSLLISEARLKPNATLFTNCKTHLGTRSQVLALYNRFMHRYFIGRFQLRNGYIKHLCRGTSAQDLELEILRLFSRLGSVDLLEVLSVLIIHGYMPWQEKIKLTIYIFDFDGNKYITRDEMVFLYGAFTKGLCRVYDLDFPTEEEIQNAATQTFRNIDKLPDNKVTLEELTQWVSFTPAVLKLLQKNSPPYIVHRRSRTANLSKKKFKPLFVMSKRKRYTREYVQKLNMNFKSVAGNKFTVRKSKLVKEIKDKKLGQLILKKYNTYDPEIEFKDLLEAVCNDCEKFQLNSMLDWVNYKGDYFDDDAVKPNTYLQNYLNDWTIRRCKAIFDRVDKNNDGVLDYTEMKNSFGKAIDIRSLEFLYIKFGIKNHEINFEEFMKIITPDTYSVGKEAAELIHKLSKRVD